MRLFSYKDRPFHLGPYPLENVKRRDGAADLSRIPAMTPLSFRRPQDPLSLVNAMQDYQAMLDAIRDGSVKDQTGEIPDDLAERARHLKSFGYYCDASQAGVCALPKEAILDQAIVNPDIARLADILKHKQTSTLASGVDVVMAELKETMETPASRIDHHSHVIVYLYEFPRDPASGEPGTDWIGEAQLQRAALRAAETTVVISNYIRLLGYEARGHSHSSTDVNLHALAVAAGLGEVRQDENGPYVENPYLGRRFGIGAITTTLPLLPDRPLAPSGITTKWRSHGPAWWLGISTAKSALNQLLYKDRRFKDGAYPFERSQRQETPTTFIDEPRVARVPKRTDMFARALFGDMGRTVQEATKNGNYVRKNPTSFAARRALGAFILIQNGDAAPEVHPAATEAQRNADNVKAALNFLGADAVGISRCPDWAYYSHDAGGAEITPYHQNAISVIIDQGHETMDGASGDDWIACAQSMRAYLRFSLLGGIVAGHIRNLGYSARAHTVMDGEVLQPPLLLLAGLGEVSRIGEVILNPYLGPRLKSGVITTDMPLAHDKPINFGLQNFCNNCNKCARECPSGAITAGPKLMFNGYEIWKSDSQKCTTYRVSQTAGAMCGRCMKTCPWNLEGLFAEAPFRWLATKAPWAARFLAHLDDRLGHGRRNPHKKWWWDLVMENEGPYKKAASANERELQTDLDLKYEDQTLAVYPANLAPPPYPAPFPMDREEGIAAYEKMITPRAYQDRLAKGETQGLAHEFRIPAGPPPVFQVQVVKAERMTDDVTKYEFTSLDGAPLPAFDAGAHIDVAVAPEFFRQYSLSGDPADRARYQIAVLREDEGRGGSKLMHRIFSEGRKVFISPPRNHFPLVEDASKSYLMGGGIGITPMIAMAHRLYALGRDFEVHYSCRSRASAGFLADLATVPWRDNVHLHFSDEGSRVDLGRLFRQTDLTQHIYVCGPDRFMTAVLDAGEAAGWPEENLHREYFAVPEGVDYVNHPFTVKLAQSGREIRISADQNAAEALIAAGIPVDVKCSDGLCGVCACGLLEGEVEHRDFVLSKKDRDHKIILCSSRAVEEGGIVVVDL
ncbi:reductive dehalogenase [Paremcibacter congregatus]|uniref:NAD-binding oxidoreductase n=1 Tax=Paremcibacter congregatus TaxID=2043170 RepID=A0A2G4YTY5_9PROT|nr:reductive dehalogenase [Paremcibacter congregatus]PHZ85737.1 NAD-binding oxidoreductase [Paremcibacter congregatus]QDE26701.1 reductive dehalogenase [Paremcibacter congregatus]